MLSRELGFSGMTLIPVICCPKTAKEKTKVRQRIITLRKNIVFIFPSSIGII
jgi:hypothetical protein